MLLYILSFSAWKANCEEILSYMELKHLVVNLERDTKY